MLKQAIAFVRPRWITFRLMRFMNFRKNALTSPVLGSLLSLLLLGLSACTTVSIDENTSADDTVESAIELAADQQQGGLSQESMDAGLVLPKLELDAQTLENLLVSNLASYQANWDLATSRALLAANSSKDPRVARIATLLALRKNDYASAADAAGLWRQLAPDSDDSLNMQIISQLGAGLTEQAIELLALHRKDKSLERHIKQVAGLLVRQPNEESAMAVANHYVAAEPDSSQAMLSMAYVAETFKRLDIASEWLDRALTLESGWDLAAQMKANMLRREGKDQERSAFIADYVAAHPSSVAMRINHAAELAREKQYQQALELMQVVLKDAPRNVSALSYAAALALQLEDNTLAKKYYTKALYVSPNDDDVRWSLARIAVLEKNYVKAERLYNDIVSKENYINAQLQVANMRYQTEGLKSAVNTLRALQPETEAEYVEVALTRHYLLMQDHQYDDAFGYINETLIYLPDNLDLIYARALVSAELNKVAVAEADFKAIIANKPDHANALNALGYTLADQTDRYEEALGFIEKALELRPDDAHILDSRGWVAYRMNDYDTAIEFLERAFSASPQVEIAAHLGEVFWEAGQPEKAKQVWQKSFAEDPNNPVLNKTLEKYGVSFKESSQ